MGWTKNFGNPEGFIGKMFLSFMNIGHTPVSKWGLSFYDWQADTSALDIGCGGGRNIKRILKMCPQGYAAGIDISKASVSKSKKANFDELGERCDIALAGAEKIPHEDNRFDVVTTFESIYFWPDVPKAFREVLRVLRPSGRFLIVCEVCDPNSIWNKTVEGMRIYASEELEKMLKEAGYTDIRSEKNRGGWLCAMGSKPKSAQ